MTSLINVSRELETSGGRNMEFPLAVLFVHPQITKRQHS